MCLISATDALLQHCNKQACVRAKIDRIGYLTASKLQAYASCVIYALRLQDEIGV
jgi:hypothetical protein